MLAKFVPLYYSWAHLYSDYDGSEITDDIILRTFSRREYRSTQLNIKYIYIENTTIFAKRVQSRRWWVKRFDPKKLCENL